MSDLPDHYRKALDMRGRNALKRLRSTLDEIENATSNQGLQMHLNRLIFSANRLKETLAIENFLTNVTETPVLSGEIDNGND